MSTAIIDDLFRYNSWANGRVFRLSHELPDEQLDEPREMGFGSLRNTLFHILAAEEIWLDRWIGAPRRPFPVDAEALPLAEIEARLEQTAERRRAVIDRHRANNWSAICEYRDSKGVEYRNRIGDLLLHVANHGIWHRSQALNYLKRFGRTIPAGIDYLFFRFARPVIEQEPATTGMMRQYGLSVAEGRGSTVTFDGDLVTRFYAYGDWANAALLEIALQMDDAALDLPFEMGIGSIRKNLLHIQDAERWWLANWTTGTSAFDRAAESTPVATIQQTWREVIDRRNAFIAGLDHEAAGRTVIAVVGKMTVRVQVIESLLQLCGHGTHHRAQVVNMMRQCGHPAPPSDYVLWTRG